MINAEFLKKSGYDTDWSRKEWMKKMGLTQYSFDSAVKTMTTIGLLTKKNNELGNKVYYSFDMGQYNNLVAILSVTHNVSKLIDFCETKFKKEKRTVADITLEEVAELEEQSGSGLKKKLKST
jgi:hypothetical protein